MRYIIQGLGFIGMIFVVSAFQNNDKKKILILQGTAGAVFAVHFYLLGAFTGSGLNAAEVLRNIVYARFENPKWKGLWAAIFTIIFAAVGALTWQNWLSLLPIFAMSLSNFAVALKNPRNIRLCFLPVFIGWLIYNIASGSIAGVLTEAFDITSLLIAFWRFDIRKK